MAAMKSEPSVGRIQLVCAFPVLGVVVLTVLTVAIVKGNLLGDIEVDSAGLIAPIFTVLSVMLVILSFGLKALLVSQLPNGRAPAQRIFNIAFIAVALAEFGGVAGFIVGILTRDLTLPMICFGSALAGCLLQFPTRAWLTNHIE